MEVLSIFAISLTIILIGFVVLLLAVAGFCSFMKRIEKKKGLSPKMTKLVYILDWMEDDKR